MPFAFLNVTQHSGTCICIFNSHEKNVCHIVHTAATVFTREKSKAETNREDWEGAAEADMLLGTAQTRFIFHYQLSL